MHNEHEAIKQLELRVQKYLLKGGRKRNMLRKILMDIRETVDIDAVAFRLKEGNDYPYYEVTGFSDDFVEAERSLCARNENGDILLDTQGNPVLECMCGNIIQGRTDPSFPFFTSSGSFYSNCTTKLLAGTSDADRQSRTRNRCNGEGYESVALIPLPGKNGNIGLLQLNDTHCDRYSPEFIRVMEKIAHDISEGLARMLAEEELRKLKTTTEQSLSGIAVVDLQGYIQYINPYFANIHQYTTEELLGKNLNIFHSKDQLEAVNEINKELINMGNYTGKEVWHTKKDGTPFLMLMNAIVIRDDEGAPQFMTASAVDLTDKKRMEEELLQTHKMEAIGTLAGGIAHHFNNLLSIILGFSDHIKEDVSPGSSVDKYADEILRAGTRGSELVNQILAFSQKTELNLKPVELHFIIQELTRMMRSLLPATIEIQQDIDTDSGVILADTGQLHQMVINLCTNAAHAMENQQGILRISLHRCKLTTAQIPVSKVVPGSFVVLTVSDTGCGMTAAMMDHIFEPFFTTKEVGEGLGMGLSVVHGIVEDFKGFHEVESVPGEGSAFRIYFPALPRETNMQQKTISRESLATGTENILAVGDEEGMVNLHKVVLTRLGYTVTTTTNGQTALEIFNTNSQQFDLIITDQSIQGLTGIKLAEAVHKLNPTIPIILCTGYHLDLTTQQAREIGICKILHKPVRTKQLATVIRSILDQT